MSWQAWCRLPFFQRQCPQTINNAKCMFPSKLLCQQAAVPSSLCPCSNIVPSNCKAETSILQGSCLELCAHSSCLPCFPVTPRHVLCSSSSQFYRSSFIIFLYIHIHIYLCVSSLSLFLYSFWVLLPLPLSFTFSLLLHCLWVCSLSLSLLFFMFSLSLTLYICLFLSPLSFISLVVLVEPPKGSVLVNTRTCFLVFACLWVCCFQCLCVCFSFSW